MKGIVLLLIFNLPPMVAAKEKGAPISRQPSGSVAKQAAAAPDQTAVPAAGKPLAEPPARRPNILLILTDEQFAGAMSCAGNPNVKTPAMDSLAAGGVRFTEAYPTSPVCSPSRASFFTGLFPHQNGVPLNGQRVRSDLRGISIERLLTNAGYESAYAGKWHIAASKTIGKAERKWRPFRVLAETNDARVTRACVKYLKEERDRPFFLVASYVNPHDISLWAMDKQKEFQKDLPAEVPLDQCPPLPANFGIPKDEPSVLREFYLGRHVEHQSFTKEKWRRYLHAYYRMIETVDAEIGQLLEGLRSSGLEKDTLVVFTSDHGDGMAAHQWLGKCTHYEESMRVPLIVSFPGVVEAGRVDRAHLVSNGPDFYATALDYAGVAIPKGCQGLSLRRLLESGGGSPPWRDQVVSEIWIPGGPDPAQGREWKSAWGRMLRTARFKYAIYDRGENRELLFDMENDRDEMHNLSSDPAHDKILNEHRRRLAAWCEKTQDTQATSFLRHPRIEE